MTITDTQHAWTMDRIYRRQRHIYDITRKYFLLGRDRLIAGLDVPDGGTVLELGCGTGRNLVAIARRYPTARVFGIDLSEEMLMTATQSVSEDDLRAQITLAQGDATAFDCGRVFGVARVDRIVVSYALSMMPAWRKVIDNAARQLAPGGEIHVVDFGQQSGLQDWFRSLLRAWLRRFHVEPRRDLEHVLHQVACRIGGGCRLERLYRDYAWYGVVSAPA